MLILISILLVVITGTMIFSMTDTNDPAPDTVIRLDEQTEGPTVTLQYQGGDRLDGDQTELIGAANPDAVPDQFSTGDKIEVVPVDETLRLVWKKDGSSYTLETYDVKPDSLPHNPGDVDKDCSFAESNIGDNGDLDMSGEKAECNVRDDTDTGETDVNVDLSGGSTLVGDIDTDGDVDLDQSKVVGGITTDADDITITGNSEVYGDVVAQPGTNIDIDGDSEVYGDAVAKNGDLYLTDVTVTGHVYVDDDDFSCSGDTVIGPDEKSCSEYDTKDPADY